MLIESYSLARLSGFPVSNSYLVRLCANFNRNLFLVDWALNKRSDSAGDPVGGFKDVTVFAQLTSGTFMRTFILNGMGVLSYQSSAPPAVKESYEGERHYHRSAHCG